MNTPQRYPIRDGNPFARIQNEINRAFDRFFGESFWNESSHLLPALNIEETKDKYIVEAELPGIETKDIDLEINGNTLTIRAERRQKEELRDQRHAHIIESRYGSYQRSFTLPENVAVDQITAESKNGILTIYIPKDQSKRPHRIEIREHGDHQHPPN